MIKNFKRRKHVILEHLYLCIPSENKILQSLPSQTTLAEYRWLIVGFRAPAVFQVNERSIMQAARWLLTGSFAYPSCIALGTTAGATWLPQGYLNLIFYSSWDNPLTC